MGHIGDLIWGFGFVVGGGVGVLVGWLRWGRRRG